jgi:hypothetical protein
MMSSRPFVINREVRVNEPDPDSPVLADLRRLLLVIEMPDYDEFPNTQAEIYAMMAKYDAFPVFFDEVYHERYGGQSG